MSNDGWTYLHYAATRANTNPSEMATRIQRGNVSAKTSEGHTPLHIAAKFGQEVAVRQLLVAKAPIDARDNNNQTPLSLCACFNIDPIIPQLLVDAGADVEAGDNYSWKPIFWASFRDFHRTYDVLRGAGAKIDVRDKSARTPLHWAAERGSTGVLRKMLEEDRFLDLQTKDANDHTPILGAAREGKVESLELLIAHDAHKNVKDKNSWTPLFWAAYKGHMEAVRYLVDRRARTDITDLNGKRAVDRTDSPQIKALLMI